MSDLRKAADAAETALAELVKQGQADEAAFKEQIASPDGELTGEAYDALLAVHLAQRHPISPYISPISPDISLYLPYISLYLPYISPISPLTTDGRTGKVCAARVALLEPGTILREVVLSGR